MTKNTEWYDVLIGDPNNVNGTADHDVIFFFMMNRL